MIPFITMSEDRVKFRFDRDLEITLRDLRLSLSFKVASKMINVYQLLFCSNVNVIKRIGSVKFQEGQVLFENVATVQAQSEPRIEAQSEQRVAAQSEMRTSAQRFLVLKYKIKIFGKFDGNSWNVV